jgi:hypothetical protein
VTANIVNYVTLSGALGTGIAGFVRFSPYNWTTTLPNIPAPNTVTVALSAGGVFSATLLATDSTIDGVTLGWEWQMLLTVEGVNYEPVVFALPHSNGSTQQWPSITPSSSVTQPIPFLVGSNNLADLTSPSTARTNLGIGSLPSAPSLRLIYVDEYAGTDYTGATDSTAGFLLAQAAGGSGPYRLVLGEGTYLLGTSENLNTFGREQGLTGPGHELCTISYAGNATCLAAYDSSFGNSSLGGQFGGFTMDGTNAGADAVGLSWGNLLVGRGHDIVIQNFSGASAMGIYFHNGADAWSEEAEWTGIKTNNCTVGVCFDTGSFDYSVYQFLIVALSGQDGLRLQNNASLEGCRLELRGNFTTGAGNTGAVIAIDRSNSSGTSRIDKALMFISVEPDGSTGLGHYTVLMQGGSSSQFNGTGVLHFLPGSPGFQAGTFAGSYGFSGLIDEPGLGSMVNGDAGVFWGGTEWNVRGSLASGGFGGTVYTSYGDIQCFQLSSGSNSLTFSGAPSLRAKRVELFIAQPASGAAGTVTWTNVTWQAGSAPVLQTANSAVDRLRFTWLPTPAVWYGEYIGLDQNVSDVSAPGALALGSTGKPGDAGHVHPSPEPWMASDQNYLAWNMDPGVVTGTFAPVAGTIYTAGIWVRQPITVGHIAVAIGSAASGVTSAENWIALYNSSGTRLAQTATDSSYGSSYSVASVAVAVGAIQPGFYWAEWVMNASSMPALARAGGGVEGALMNAGLTAATARAATAGTTQTTLPSSFTPSSALTLASSTFWVALAT